MADNPEAVAAANPPIAPQPQPKEIPSYFDNLRVRLAPTIAGVADVMAGGGIPFSQELAAAGKEAKNIVTDPHKRLDFLTGMVGTGGEGENPFEGLRVRKVNSMVSPEGKPFDAQAFPHTQHVRVEWPEHNDSIVDAIKGLNKGHAVARAKENWPGATITPIEPSEYAQSLAKEAGLKYKGELTSGSDVHQFEHPENPGKTMAVKGKDLTTPEALKSRMDSKLEEFKPKPETPVVKTLPPIGDNFRTDLSKFTNTLHHETNIYRALEMLPTGGVIADQPAMYFSNTPDLATGQGRNTGVHLEFEPKGIEGQVNRSKPMADEAYKQGQAEFWSKINNQKTLQDNLKAVTVKKDAQTNSKGEKFRMNQALDRLEKLGWKKTNTEDGVRYERPNQKVTGAEKLGAK